jgi:hypothetical protein
MGRIASIFQRSRKTPEPPETRATFEEEEPSTSAIVDKSSSQQQLPVVQLARRSSGVAAAVQERLAKEVLRKLHLATDAEEKEDRDIVCSEVFADITGELNTAARGKINHLFYYFISLYLYTNKKLIIFLIIIFLMYYRKHWCYL